MINALLSRKAFALSLLFIVISFGFYIRFDNLSFWNNNSSIYFFPSDNTPLTLNIDSYYYLDIAKDLLQGTLEKSDYQRQAPKWYDRPVSMPLLSISLALASKISGKSLEWSGVFLPPFLAILLGIPVYLFLTLFLRSSNYVTDKNAQTNVTIAGAIAALFALISPAFVERSSLGWCDTDIMNVTLLCTLSVVSYYCAVASNTRNLKISLCIYTLVAILFLFWWDQATPVVTAFILGYLFLAALFGISRQKSDGLYYLISLLVIGLIVWAIMGSSILQLPKNIISLLQYSTSKDTSGSIFVYAGNLVDEQKDTTLALMSKKIAGNSWLFGLSIVGTILLTFISRKYALFLLPWIVLSFMTMKSHRLMIFTSVPFGLGLGTVFFLTLRYLRSSRLKIITPLAILLVVACAWFPFKESQSYYSKKPKNSAYLMESFKHIATIIPQGSVLWSSWGHGHPLIFYTEAKTIGDGIFHPPILVYTQYFPYASASNRLAANWISFYSMHGQDGLQRMNTILAGKSTDWANGIPALKILLASGIEETRKILMKKYTLATEEAEELLSFIFPVPSSPVYILLDYITYEEQWFKWGRMTFQEKNRSFNYTMVPINAPFQSGNNMKGKSELGMVHFDLTKGIGKVGNNENIQVEQLKVDNGKTKFTHYYKDPSTWNHDYNSLLLNQNNFFSYGALVDNNVLNTVFTKMFFLKEYDEQFFQPVLEASPLMSLYLVKGEVYRKKS